MEAKMEKVRWKTFKRRGCDCRHSQHGNPKYGHGCCNMSMDLRPAVRERVDGKRYCRRFVAGELPEES